MQAPSEPRRILLVEDDPADARLIQRAFDRAGIGDRISRLTNGDAAVAYLSRQGEFAGRGEPLDRTILVLDIKLPRRSGLEVLRWLREQHGPLATLPVVMLTSSRHSLDVNQAYDLGVNSYLVKPESTHDLYGMAETFRHYWIEENRFPEFRL